MTRAMKFWLGGSAALCLAQAACGSSGSDPGTGGAAGTGTASSSTGGGTTSHGTGGASHGTGGAGGGGNHGAGGMGGTGGANTCVPLGYHCEGDDCCEGTCPDNGGNCCGGAGTACDVSVPNPDAFCCLGNKCDTENGKCVPLTCISPKEEGVCILLPGIPCCTVGTQCTFFQEGPGGPFSKCCAPDGTKLPHDQASHCCSNGVQDNGDGTVTCIAPP